MLGAEPQCWGRGRAGGEEMPVSDLLVKPPGVSRCQEMRQPPGAQYSSGHIRAEAGGSISGDRRGAPCEAVGSFGCRVPIISVQPDPGHSKKCLNLLSGGFTTARGDISVGINYPCYQSCFLMGTVGARGACGVSTGCPQLRGQPGWSPSSCCFSGGLA